MILTILKIIAALGTIVVGLVALVRPLAVLGFTGLEVRGPRGVTEVRVVLGALFVALGAIPLVFNQPLSYQMLGITYLSLGVVRTVSMFLDRSVETSNLVSIATELIFGVILVL